MSGTQGLSAEEREALAKAVVSDFVDHAHHNPAHGLGVFDRSRCDRIVAPAVERILASRTAALTAERDALREERDHLRMRLGSLGHFADALEQMGQNLRAALRPTDGAT